MKKIVLVIGIASFLAGMLVLNNRDSELAKRISSSMWSFILSAIFLRAYWMLKKHGELKL